MQHEHRIDLPINCGLKNDYFGSYNASDEQTAEVQEE